MKIQIKKKCLLGLLVAINRERKQEAKKKKGQDQLNVAQFPFPLPDLNI